MSRRDFEQTIWNSDTIKAAQELVRWALLEDLMGSADLMAGRDVTSEAVIPASAVGSAQVVARQAGVVAGLPIIPLVLSGVRELQITGSVEWRPLVQDGQSIDRGTRLGSLVGNARAILAAERTLLNALGHLSGVASETRRYVTAVQPHGARIYDTRKTLPGWRRLDKYAVRCGGGWNHRLGLYAAIMVKDNHLALANQVMRTNHTAVQAVQLAKDYRNRMATAGESLLIEIELDRLDALGEVLAAEPDLVLLDNMSVAQLKSAVDLRQQMNVPVQLEASGGVNLATVAEVAATGVDRISVGALTHSAPALDIALDWD